MDLGIWEECRDRLSFSRLGKPALIGLAALLVMVAVFAGKNIIETATASEFKIDHGSAEQESVSAQEPATIFVHVSGAVKHPGLVELTSGSRVADAVNGAGGFEESAAVDSVNLARVLQDGEQIFVADTKASDATNDEDGGAVEAVTAAQRGTDSQTAGAWENRGGKVNLNTASSTELESLPGIGPSTAAKIIADRTANGSFASPEELMRVSGIGEKKYAALADLVCV